MKHTYMTLPNCITALRMVGTLFLLVIEPLTALFFVVYSLTGVTDVLDGYIARKTGCVTEFGSKLDSVADLLFYGVMLLRIFPVMWVRLPGEIWFAVGLIIAIRAASYFLAASKTGELASLHTYMNKLSGFAVFCIPYVILESYAVPVCSAVCMITALASAEELLIHIREKSR
ncbi:MAG: CDP-alcohol phosphatidyltransferase family protein, partial [Oscillospiraceae bacterium]|nr:CDP-alcohol phosphatidyltransferase family protein [Oscillospiraceae bacterium]